MYLELLGFTAKLIIGLTTLFAVTKFLGKTKISQITPFDFIFGIVLGELMVRAIYEGRSVIDIIYPIVLWGFLIYLLEWIGQKSYKLRGFLENSPAIIIRDGQIDQRQLKKNKLNLSQLQNLLRQKDVFSVREVKYGILEANGALTILLNSSVAAPTRADLNLPQLPVYLPYTIISDGKLIRKNLSETGFDQSWFRDQLAAQKINRIQDVFYAEWQEGKGLLIVPKQRSS